MMSTPAGWYPDYDNPANIRYYDGTSWTEHVQPSEGYSNTPNTYGLNQTGVKPVDEISAWVMQGNVTSKRRDVGKFEPGVPESLALMQLLVGTLIPGFMILTASFTLLSSSTQQGFGVHTVFISIFFIVPLLIAARTIKNYRKYKKTLNNPTTAHVSGELTPGTGPELKMGFDTKPSNNIKTGNNDSANFGPKPPYMQ